MCVQICLCSLDFNEPSLLCRVRHSRRPFAGLVPHTFISQIPQLLKYEGYEFAHPRLAPPLRPMVAHEVALEGMRQAEVRIHEMCLGACTGRCTYESVFLLNAL